jgi:hypothetical protein
VRVCEDAHRHAGGTPLERKKEGRRAKRRMVERGVVMAQAAEQVKVRNVSGSTAGSGSGDFHRYRGQRERELKRLEAMDHAHEAAIESEIYAERRAERIAKEEAQTAKKREKRHKKKQQAKHKAQKEAHHRKQPQPTTQEEEKEPPTKREKKGDTAEPPPTTTTDTSTGTH